MVRANANDPPEDKKESTRKKNAIKKKSVVTGSWPCKINGCNKQFAREADLKRHQRTTKLHSMPGFACPQCDATFTRTDALRRHQKSRHNGIVIEPLEQEPKDEADDDAGSSESQSKSRSPTPSSKGKERASSSRTQNTSAQSHHSGPSSYYRQHTATTSAYVPRLRVMDPQYAQIALPTSATRLNLATNWGYPHPWSDGSPSQMGPISYHPMNHVYYSPHYRPNGDGPHSSQSPPERSPDQQGRGGPVHEARARSSSPQPNHTQAPSQDSQATESSSTKDKNPNIDPILDSTESATLTEQQVLAIAMQAVLDVEKGSVRSESGTGSSSTSPRSEAEGGGDKEDEEAPVTPAEEKNDNIHRYGPPLQRPEPMEHMLTEDGEPMLNPAELLTQESLASPPPS